MAGTAIDLWVFGYGSLMWDPGFKYAEVQPAVVHGWHRALCVFSIRYRGTQERPGLVLGLDRGGCCHGRAYRVEAANVEAVRDYLWEREMVSAAYRPTKSLARLDGGAQVRVLTFVARHDHPQYAGKRDPESAAALVAQGHGPKGSALDYLRNVVCHLDGLGIRDGTLHRTLRLAEQMAAPR